MWIYSSSVLDWIILLDFYKLSGPFNPYLLSLASYMI